MPGDANIAAVATLLADPTRVSILMNLSDGRAFTATELAHRSRVAPSTASAHLNKLVEAALIDVEKQGRHRYFRLVNPTIVTILEELAVFAPAGNVHSLREAAIGDAVRKARTCYNHLAGTLGVELTQAFVKKQYLLEIEDGYTMTEDGMNWFATLGVDAKALHNKHGLFVPRHIDWSERRHHIAGTLAAAVTHRLFEREWIKRIPSSRAVCLTEVGQGALFDEFGICWQ